MIPCLLDTQGSQTLRGRSKTVVALGKGGGKFYNGLDFQLCEVKNRRPMLHNNVNTVNTTGLGSYK